MRLQDVLKKVHHLTRHQVMREVKEGFIRPRVEQKTGRTFYHYSPADVLKLSMLVELTRKGLDHREARRMVEEKLKQKVDPGKSAISIIVLDGHGKPLKSRGVVAEGAGIVFQTDSEGKVSSVSLAPDSSSELGLLKETMDALGDLIEFYKDLKVSGMVTDNQVEGIKLILDEYEKISQSGARTKREVFNNVAGGLIKGIAELLSGSPDCVVVPAEVCRALESVPRPALKCLAFAPKVTPENIAYDRDLGPLFLSGFYGTTREGFTLGTARPAERADLPGVNLLIPLGNLENLFDPTEYRRWFFERIAKDYGIDGMPDCAGLVRPLPQNEFQEYIRVLRRAISYAERRFGELFTFLPDDASFYCHGRRMYEASFSIFIFATTSGLLIPDEYTGREKSKFRPRYFEEGPLRLSKEMPARYYQWDRDKSSAELWKCCHARPRTERVSFKQHATALLARALRIPGLELSEASFSEAPWKRHFTLVTEERVMFSVRSQDKRIGHGVIAQKGFIDTAKVCDALSTTLPSGSPRPNSVLDFVQTNYRSENKRTIKALGQVYDSEESLKLAESIVDEHIKLGQQLESNPRAK